MKVLGLIAIIIICCCLLTVLTNELFFDNRKVSKWSWIIMLYTGMLSMMTATIWTIIVNL